MPRAANSPRHTVIEYIKKQINVSPAVGVVLGSGLQELSNSLEDVTRIAYSDIPSFTDTTIKGHAGEFVVGRVRGTTLPVIFANGRFHHYEGLSYDKVHIIIDIFSQLGCGRVITTNSSGCLVPSWSPGDIMIIDSHIDMTFRNSPDDIDKKSGSSYYDPRLMRLAQDSMDQMNLIKRQGTYGWTLGPTYETPAEVKLLQRHGVSAVGMSTVPEIERAHDLGLNLLSIACLTNYAAGISDHPLSHEEVVDQATKSGKTFSELVLRILTKIDQP